MYKSSDKYIDLKNNKDRDRVYNLFDESQKKLFNSVKDNIFTYCCATSGSGKTLVSVAAMLDMLANDDISKIIYIQKVSSRFLQNGFLPGGIEDKTRMLWTPFYDAMETLGYQPEYVDRIIEFGSIELCTDCAMRGVNFDNVGVILDEVENCDYHTLKLIYTRCKDNCHIVSIGDNKQKDSAGKNTDFIGYNTYLSSSNIGNKCELVKNYRGKFSQLAEEYGG
jgi:phosphate starvation-inducible protein PhoH